MKGIAVTIIGVLISVAGCRSSRTTGRSDLTDVDKNGRLASKHPADFQSSIHGESTPAYEASTIPKNSQEAIKVQPLQRASYANVQNGQRNEPRSGHFIDAKHVKAKPTDGGTLTIATLEAMAMTNNPTLVQATAQVRAARAAAYQAGRYPNPVIGYSGEQIGVNGTAGEFQGGFIGQEFVTGGKLRLSREKHNQRARIAETNLQAQQQRVLNDVRIAFYRAVAAQQLVTIHRGLLTNGEDNLQTHKEMLNLGQTNQAGLLQAEVDLQQDRLRLRAAQNNFQKTWRELVALVGIPDLKQQPLADLEGVVDGPLAWDAALNQVLSHSPELIAAWEKVRHDEITVRRERVEPIPNLLVGGNIGRNTETRETVGSVSVGIPLPIFDRNRGTVRQALADLSRSQAETRRLELALRTRLAAHYRDYRTAWQHVEDFRTIMIPRTKKAYDLLHASYKKRRAAWPDVLRAQRRHLDLQAQYANNLLRFREADVAIRGMLLTGGLMEPAGPISGGHIDATPKPR